MSNNDGMAMKRVAIALKLIRAVLPPASWTDSVVVPALARTVRRTSATCSRSV